MMKTLNPNNNFDFASNEVRELTFEEIDFISGGRADEDSSESLGDGATHGKGCGCMACRLVRDFI
jgi:hypothetical protein